MKLLEGKRRELFISPESVRLGTKIVGVHYKGPLATVERRNFSKEHRNKFQRRWIHRGIDVPEVTFPETLLWQSFALCYYIILLRTARELFGSRKLVALDQKRMSLYSTESSRSNILLVDDLIVYENFDAIIVSHLHSQAIDLVHMNLPIRKQSAFYLQYQKRYLFLLSEVST